jgi:hypothetical protein
MTIATGIAKQLRYKKEPSINTAPASTSTGVTALRRTQSTVDLKKATFQSKEINTTMQVSNFRHGLRSVDGNIAGELSPGTYSDFMASITRQGAGNWAATVAAAGITGLSAAQVGAADSTSGTVTRGAGSFITDGIRIGDVLRMTGWTTTATALNARNLWVTGINTAGTILSGVLLDENPGLANVDAFPTKASETGAVILTVQGKKVIAPTSGHVNDSYRIEHWFSDIGQSEVFGGCRLSSMDVNLPATGFAEVTFGVMGLDMSTGSSAYYTGTMTSSASNGLTAVNGMLIVDGAVIGNVSGLQFKCDGGMSAGQVIGSNISPDVFIGTLNVTGQFTAYFQDAGLRDKFLAETEVSLAVVMVDGSGKTADFIGFTLPRIKIGGASKDDSEQGLTLTCPFQALLYSTATGVYGAAANATTLVIQDSQAA